MANGFIKVVSTGRTSTSPLQVSESSLEVLGGVVEALVEKWKVSLSLAEFTRSDLRLGPSGEVGITGCY